MKDKFGLSISTNIVLAAENYIKGIDIALAANANAELHFNNAILEDEEFALPYAALALLHDMWGRVSESKYCINKAINLSIHITKREKNHIIIIQKILNNEKNEAFLMLKSHVFEFPQDAFIVSQITGAYGILAFSGNKNFEIERLYLLESIKKYYDNDWWLDGMYAYSLTEVNRHDEARKLAESSLQKYYHNGHTSHTYSHILYETKQYAEGEKFLNQWFENYDESAPIAGHIRWHQALIHSYLGNPTGALAIYKSKLKPSISTSPNYGKVIDAASLLWRLELKNNKINQSLWSEIIDFSDVNFKQTGDPFLDIHKYISYIHKTDKLTNEKLNIKLFYDSKQDETSKLVSSIFTLFDSKVNQNHKNTEVILSLIIEDLPRIGGSHAQRDFINETATVN